MDACGINTHDSNKTSWEKARTHEGLTPSTRASGISILNPDNTAAVHESDERVNKHHGVSTYEHTMGTVVPAEHCKDK